MPILVSFPRVCLHSGADNLEFYEFMRNGVYEGYLMKHGPSTVCITYSSHVAQGPKKRKRNTLKTNIEIKRRLDKKLSSGHQIPKLPSLVWRAYREEYTNDPVSQKSFEALLKEYRPSPPSTTPLQQCEDFVAAMRTNGEDSERNAGESDANGRLLAVDNHHETRRQREAVRDYQPVQEGVFTEFVEAWKNVMSGRFRLDNNTVSTRLGDERQRRGLDVLSWGFGE